MGSVGTDFLTSNPTFVTGMGSAVNLAGNFYGFNYAPSEVEADRRALRSDWQMVGKDVADSMAKAEENPQCLKK